MDLRFQENTPASHKFWWCFHLPLYPGNTWGSGVGVSPLAASITGHTGFETWRDGIWVRKTVPPSRMDQGGLLECYLVLGVRWLNNILQLKGIPQTVSIAFPNTWHTRMSNRQLDWREGTSIPIMILQAKLALTCFLSSSSSWFCTTQFQCACFVAGVSSMSVGLARTWW